MDGFALIMDYANNITTLQLVILTGVFTNLLVAIYILGRK